MVELTNCSLKFLLLANSVRKPKQFLQNGVTPKHHAVSPPNINSLSQNANGLSGAIDHGASVMSAVSAVSGISALSTETEDPRKRRKKEKRKRKRLRSEFENLPAPNYEYKVALPKMPEKPFESDRLLVMDRADRDEMAEQEKEREFEEIKKSVLFKKEGQSHLK